MTKRHGSTWVAAGVRPGTLAALALAICALLVPASAFASASSASRVAEMLPRIEVQVMCVTCKIPLNTAESPQANLERGYIKGLIREGLDEAQIKKALVSQYGPAVLSLPSGKGFNVAVYAVPVAVVLALLALLALLLPRWRRAARAAGPQQAPSPLGAADAERLRRDMARFD